MASPMSSPGGPESGAGRHRRLLHRVNVGGRLAASSSRWIGVGRVPCERCHEVIIVKRRLLAAAATLALLLSSAPVAGAAGEVRVTGDSTASSYLRDVGASDATMAACSTGRRSQNEPTIAVDPSNSNVVVAGANDYCAQIVNGDVWAGYYRSTDGGHTWHDSLVPGYPADSSSAGTASPAHGSCGAAGDPTQAFDAHGRLFYGFICFNRSKPINGSLYVATYGDHGASYTRTALVDSGSPSGQFGAGVFQDKVNLTVDQTGGPHDGYVYVAWAKYAGIRDPNNVIQFSRSTDHGTTFSRPIRVTQGLAEEQFADLAVGADGAIYLTFRTFGSQGPTRNAIWIAKSTDGGLSWSSPNRVALISPFDSNDFSGTGAPDCGDGPFACPSGLTFSRFGSLSAVAADATGVHLVWSAELPSGQAKIFVRNSPDGLSWPTPAATIDAVAAGHQWFPDIASADGTISVVFYDSRFDPVYSPGLPPGNTVTGQNSGNVVDAIAARSTDGGTAWVESPLTSTGSNFGWETHGSRRIGFWGDYIYVSAVSGAAQAAWTDSRDLVPGSDPREAGSSGDNDGFDVYQPCTYVPNDINAPSYSQPTVNDLCLSQGGLDQNIYALGL
jgi:hypothetical protein